MGSRTIESDIYILSITGVKDSRRSGMSQSCFFGHNIGHAKSVCFRFESGISLRYLEITLSSLVYSLIYSRKK